MKSITIVSLLLTMLVSIAAIADDSSDDVGMMSQRFNQHMQSAQGMMMKMQGNVSPAERRKYMQQHMQDMQQMMGMMGRMNQMMMQNMPGNQGKQQGNMMGKGMMGQGNMGPGNMGQGNMSQGGMMNRGQMLEQRMDMMQGMMKQMLEHMEQLDK